MPCCTCWRIAREAGVDITIDDFRPHQSGDAVAGRSQAGRPFRGHRSVPGGREPPAGAPAAGGGRSAVRPGHRHRTHDRGRGAGGDRGSRPGGGAAGVRSDNSDRRAHHIEGQSGSRRMCRQGGRRLRHPEAPRTGAGVRQRGGLLRSGGAGYAAAGRRGRDSLRRPPRGARHARDAGGDRGHRRGRPRRFGGVVDRRPVLRRHSAAHGGHVARRRRRGGRIAAVRDGDIIVFELQARELRLEVDEAEIAERMRGWQAPAPRYATGVMAKYSRLVGSAAEGAVTMA
ncbi:Dihydroxy-acid dehydratase [Geodia barretti]|nr:Dihydroxy-acid dehydratase [Geodia barretti]